MNTEQNLKNNTDIANAIIAEMEVTLMLTKLKDDDFSPVTFSSLTLGLLAELNFPLDTEKSMTVIGDRYVAVHEVLDVINNRLITKGVVVREQVEFPGLMCLNKYLNTAIYQNLKKLTSS